MDYKITVNGEDPKIGAPEEEKQGIKDEEMIQAALDGQLFLIEHPPNRECEACKGTGSLGRDPETRKVIACECVGEARDKHVLLTRRVRQKIAARRRQGIKKDHPTKARPKRKPKVKQKRNKKKGKKR